MRFRGGRSAPRPLRHRYGARRRGGRRQGRRGAVWAGCPLTPGSGWCGTVPR